MLGKSILPTDEERGKKDDDHRFKPRTRSRASSIWAGFTNPFRRRRRRLLLAVVGTYLVYLLLSKTSSLSLGRHFTGLETPSMSWSSDNVFDEEPTEPPPGMKSLKGSLKPHEYSGQIKFYRLAESLRKASHTNGYYTVNRNVLFAFSSLKSASKLLPMVCEMAKWNRNFVHAAFMGRDDLPLKHILELNGVGNSTLCPAMWHDARPDYTEYSTDTRAELSVAAAMGHIHSYLHPQVIIMDDSLSEDAFFVRGMRTKAKPSSVPIIEIPQDGWQKFLWLTRLDSGSLSSWHKPTMDIVLQAPTGSSGGVMQLLKSVKEADYSGLKPPRVTVELPADVDPSVLQYLRYYNNDKSGQIVIRRRVAQQQASPEQSAIRLLEMFYPTSTTHSHVLLLAHNAQLSPLYYHYLYYSLLEYRYSSLGGYENDNSGLMGFSLERPSTLLDGKTGLIPLAPSDMHTRRYRQLYASEPNVPFLWQAPNSNAALYFGDKWAELHSFLSNRITKQRQSSHGAARPKKISETLPAWTEYMLELMQARGYSLLYPATRGQKSLVTLHNELYHLPEEFAPSLQASEEQDKAAHGEAFARSDTLPPLPNAPETALVAGSQPLHLALLFDGDLPELLHLPYLSTQGNKVSSENVSAGASVYAQEFREVVGGCQKTEGKHRRVHSGSTRDLFCFGDEDEDDWELDDETAAFTDEEGDEATGTITSTLASSAAVRAIPTEE